VKGWQGWSDARGINKTSVIKPGAGQERAQGPRPCILAYECIVCCFLIIPLLVRRISQSSRYPYPYEVHKYRQYDVPGTGMMYPVQDKK
jgi:hypothetical protein